MKGLRNLMIFLLLIHVTSSKILDDVRDVRELFEFDNEIQPRNIENPGLNTIVTKIFR